MGNAKTVLLLAVGVLAMPAGLLADQVMFTHAGASGSGTIGGVAFTGVPFVFTAIADTANIEDLGGDVFSLDHDSASVTIGGVGTFDFISGTRTFAAVNIIVGFSRAGSGGNDLFNGPADAAFAGYDLSTSIGPIVGDGGLLQWALSPLMETTGGTLIFDSGATTVAFTAVVVPAPAGGAFLLLGFAGVSRRRR